MDMVAAIQAAKNQLEEQKKKRGITANNTNAAVTAANLPSISSLHPAPPTNIVSFDSKKQRSSLAHPYHNNGNNQADYIHPDYQYKSNPDEEDDELTTTSISILVKCFGTILATEDSDIVHNDYGGFLLRTKFSGVDEGGVASGFATLSSPYLC
jgi:hypothetical protein